MPSPSTVAIARRATEIYESRLRNRLEREHLHMFVAIEPDSDDFFLGQTLSEAIQSARNAIPDKIPFALRIGHDSAIHLGVLSS